MQLNESAIWPTTETLVEGRPIFHIGQGVDEKTFEQVWISMSGLKSWEFSMASNSDTPWTFWCVPFTTVEPSTGSATWQASTPAWLPSLTDSAVILASQILRKELRVTRCFVNGNTFGQDGAIHQDHGVEGAYTLVYYPCFEWFPEWEGETVFYENDKRSISRFIPYAPNTFGLWDARIWHVGRAPSRVCPELRMTLVWNLLAT
jgi:hypothetical protein